MTAAKKILEYARSIAVVGMSTNPNKAAFSVPAAMQSAGYRLIPVNPSASEILGERAYAALADIPEPVDAVQVFRPSHEAPQIAREAVAIGAKALWLQRGLLSDEARGIAEAGGLDYIEDTCMGVERAHHQITQPTD